MFKAGHSNRALILCSLYYVAVSLQCIFLSLTANITSLLLIGLGNTVFSVPSFLSCNACHYVNKCIFIETNVFAQADVV